jgi:hypothetical protein
MYPRKYGTPFFLLAASMLLWGCFPASTETTVSLSPDITDVPPAASATLPEATEAALVPTEEPEASLTLQAEMTEPVTGKDMSLQPAANVVSVRASGAENAYQFSVEISSPDEGCDQYADWWEVLNEDGTLLYRRILAHSHVVEQPFTRSGGPVEVAADAVVIVRAHMNVRGYGGTAFKGSVQGGFEGVQLDASFAAEVESMEPLPTGCAF